MCAPGYRSTCVLGYGVNTRAEIWFQRVNAGTHIRLSMLDFTETLCLPWDGLGDHCCFNLSSLTRS